MPWSLPAGNRQPRDSYGGATLNFAFSAQATGGIVAVAEALTYLRIAERGNS